MLNEAAAYAGRYFIRAFEVWDSNRSNKVIEALQSWVKPVAQSNALLIKVLRNEVEAEGEFEAKNDQQQSGGLLPRSSGGRAGPSFVAR